jgi:hypothetical protein
LETFLDAVSELFYFRSLTPFFEKRPILTLEIYLPDSPPAPNVDPELNEITVSYS